MNFFNEELIIPSDWVSVAQRILCQDGTVMVLGKTDSGKTSFVHLNYAISGKKKSKDWFERKDRRKNQFREYFKNLTLMEINFSKNQLSGIDLGHGKLIDNKVIEHINQKYQIEIVFVEIVNHEMILVTNGQQKMLSKDLADIIKTIFPYKMSPGCHKVGLNIFLSL